MSLAVSNSATVPARRFRAVRAVRALRALRAVLAVLAALAGHSSGVDLVAYTLRVPRYCCGSLATRHGPPCGGPTLAPRERKAFVGGACAGRGRRRSAPPRRFEH